MKNLDVLLVRAFVLATLAITSCLIPLRSSTQSFFQGHGDFP